MLDVGFISSAIWKIPATYPIVEVLDLIVVETTAKLIENNSDNS